MCVLCFLCRYFKRFNIPDMERAKLKLEQSAISIAHANNTLIITVSVEKKISVSKNWISLNTICSLSI